MTLAWLALAVLVQAPSTRPTAARVIHEAKTLLGARYVYGDVGARGYDCSSLVQVAFGHFGALLPRTSREQAMVGAPVAADQVQPGDLLFFTSSPHAARITHVAIAIGGGRMIHASRYAHRVVISNWQQPYYRERWFAARRILGGAPVVEELGDGNVCGGRPAGLSRDPPAAVAAN